MNKIYKAIDLFAGIGGIRLGFQMAFQDEIEFVYTNEINEHCCKTYEANFDENPQGDIRKLNIKKDLPCFDILLAGFPCQAFSIAGKKEGFSDKRGNLFFYLKDILKEKKPIAFLLENVKHLQNHKKGETFQIIRDILENELKYHIHYTVLNATNFGLPQKRERIYIIGFRENLRFQFPKETNKKVKLTDILEKKVDEKYYLSQQYYNSLKKHRERHESKGNGFGYEIIPIDGIANTIVCGGMGRERNLVRDQIRYKAWESGLDPLKYKNNEGIRKMTEREWARLQGFPEEFKFPVSMTQAYKQLANSVPVSVIKEIALEMKKALDLRVEIKIKDKITEWI